MDKQFQWPLVAGALLGLTPLYAEMSEPTALAEAKKLFGPMANIAQVKGPLDTYWTKQVGVDSKGCNKEFTVLGSGLNTWDAAFLGVKADVVQGPYSGEIELVSIAWDDSTVVRFQWIIDGQPLGPEIVKEPVRPNLQISLAWNTASGPQGIHVLCTQARDAAGNVARSKAILINLDQTKPPLSRTIELLNSTGPPSARIQ